MNRHQGSSANYFQENGNYSQNSRKNNLKRTSRGMNRYNGQSSIMASIPEPVASSWSECHDSSSGHFYYWNISTNEVTWEMPTEYVRYMDQIKRYEELTGINLLHTNKRKARNAKEKSKRNFNKYQRMKGSASDFEEEKIEMITSFCAEESSDEEQESQTLDEPFKTYSQVMDNSLNSENRHIPYSYSAYERPTSTIPKPALAPFVPTTTITGPVHGPPLQKDINDGILNYNVQPTSAYPSCEHIMANLIESSNKLKTDSPKNETVNDNNIVKMLQKQAQILREKSENNTPVIAMDGIEDLIAQIEKEKPHDLDQSLENNKDIIIDKSSVSGISLVAGYGGDSDEDEDPDETESDKTVKPIKQCFPIPLDMVAPEPPIITSLVPTSDEISSMVSEETENKNVDPVPNKYCTEQVSVDKGFKRKHRIALDVLPATKTSVDTTVTNTQFNQAYIEETESNRVGFGFKNDENSEKMENPKLDSISNHSKSISFVKSKSTELKSEDSNVVNDDVKELSTVIEGKLSFLGIGNQPVAPVQLISVQFQTLLTAWKGEGLQTDYFKKWLQVTSKELTKLEIGAAPQGWECKWDRYANLRVIVLLI